MIEPVDIKEVADHAKLAVKLNEIISLINKAIEAARTEASEATTRNAGLIDAAKTRVATLETLAQTAQQQATALASRLSTVETKITTIETKIR